MVKPMCTGERGNTESQTQQLTRIQGAGGDHTTQSKGAGGLTVTLERRKLKHYPSASCVKWVYLSPVHTRFLPQ